MPRDEIVNPVPMDDDAVFDEQIRPQRLDEFPGQEPIKDKLGIAIAAAETAP